MIYKANDPDRRHDWGLVTTCREPTALVLAFVAHHVAMGAARLHLYIDAPQPDLEALLKAVPQVRLTVCDNSYWRGHIGKARPRRHQLRQLINAFDAYAQTDVAWLAHIDADEFLHTDLPLGRILAAQPDQLDYGLITVRERAYRADLPQETIFDGVFRRPVPLDWEDEAEILFGEGGRFMRRGVLGYPHGKSIMRTGQYLVPGIHTPRRPKENRDIPLRGWPLRRARLLHFDGLTALHWSAKLLRNAAAGAQDFKTNRGRVPEPQRANQIREMASFEGDLTRAYRMHQRLKTIAPDDLERLRALGLIEDHPIDPARDIAALGLVHPVDLGRAAFDLALTEQQEQVAGWHAEWERVLAAG
ncbi:MAG: glycosyltransferase family 2 protein [Sulfitobacter sp.]|nr:glycosyltransferase family 2 protein [Sulfitobacter sp.]